MTSSQMDRKKFVLFVLTLGALTAFGPLSIDMYLPSFPRIAAAFDVPLSSVELSLASFFIGLSVGQLVYGTLTDRFGRKKPLYVGLLIYFGASVACSLAPNIQSLIAFRFLQAMGACAGMVVSRAMVRDLFDHKQSARVFSLLMLVMGLAPILAPLLGGYISEVFGWRAIFALVAILSALCLGVVAALLPETRAADPSVRLSRTFHTYAEVLQDRTFFGYAISGGMAYAGMFAYVTGSPFVFIELFGIPADRYGWVFGANAIGLIGLSQLNGRLLKTYGPEQILRRSYVWLAIFGSILIVAGLMGAGLWVIIVPLFLFVATLGMTNPNSTAGALSNQGRRAGAASALLGTIQFVMAAGASSLVSVLHADSAVPMTLAMGLCSLSALIAFTYFITRRSDRAAKGARKS